MGDANTDPPIKADDADTLDGKDSSTIQDHGNLSNVTSGQHHTKTTSSDIDHANVTNVQSGQHHTKTTSLSALTDVSGVTEFIEDTSGNRPAAGTEGRIMFETDTQEVKYDDGASWNLVGNVSSGAAITEASQYIASLGG